MEADDRVTNGDEDHDDRSYNRIQGPGKLKATYMSQRIQPPVCKWKESTCRWHQDNVLNLSATRCQIFGLFPSVRSAETLIGFPSVFKFGSEMVRKPIQITNSMLIENLFYADMKPIQKDLVAYLSSSHPTYEIV